MLYPLYEMICPSRNIEQEEHTEGCFRLVEPDALQITTVDIGGTVGAIKLHSEDAGRTWTSIRPDDWPEGDPA